MLDGLKTDDERDFEQSTPVRRLSSVLISLSFFCAGISLLLTRMSEVYHRVLFASTESSGISFVDNLILVLASLPLVGTVAKKYGHISDLTYLMPFGQIFYNVLYVVGSVFVVSALFVLFNQRRSVEGVIRVLKEFPDDTEADRSAIGYAQRRATRLPFSTRKRFASEAAVSENIRYRQRLKPVILFGQNLYFPREFISILIEKNVTNIDNPLATEGFEVTHKLLDGLDYNTRDIYCPELLKVLKTLLEQQNNKDSEFSVEIKSLEARVVAILSEPDTVGTRIPRVVFSGPSERDLHPVAGDGASGTAGPSTINVHQVAKEATDVLATGTISFEIPKPVRFSIATGRINPHLKNKPTAKNLQIIQTPDGVDISNFVIGVGTVFDFNINGRIGANMELPAGNYEFEYRVEVE